MTIDTRPPQPLRVTAGELNAMMQDVAKEPTPNSPVIPPLGRLVANEFPISEGSRLIKIDDVPELDASLQTTLSRQIEELGPDLRDPFSAFIRRADMLYKLSGSALRGANLGNPLGIRIGFWATLIASIRGSRAERKNPYYAADIPIEEAKDSIGHDMPMPLSSLPHSVTSTYMERR